MGKYVPDDALKNLDSYVYKSVDKSILSKYVLNPYWNVLVKLWPKWVAPNTITFTGLCLVFINFFTLLLYDPHYLTPKHGAAGPPPWIYYTWAAGLFMYQSLDAIDGKQARRTGMAGPLGELFDHGCDAINTTLECILTAYALNLGRSWWTIASLIFAHANFYLTTWEEYHTGQLFLGVFSGPVEGILMIVGIYVISGMYGAQVWDTSVWHFLRLDQLAPTAALVKHLPPLALNEIIMVLGAVGLAFNIVTSYKNVLLTPSRSDKSALTPLARLLPFLVTTALHLSWLLLPTPATSYLLLPFRYKNSTEKASASATSISWHPPSPLLLIPFLLGWGASFAHHVGRIVLAHLTRPRTNRNQPAQTNKPLTRVASPWMDWPIWALLSAGAVLLFYAPRGPSEILIHPVPGSSPIPPRQIQTPIITPASTNIALTILTLTHLALSLGLYLRFVVMVIGDVTQYLGIACFTVRRRGKDGVWKVPREAGGKAD